MRTGAPGIRMMHGRIFTIQYQNLQFKRARHIEQKEKSAIINAGEVNISILFIIPGRGIIMKRSTRVLITVLSAALLCLLLCAAGLAETKQRTYGDGSYTSKFYVVSNGNCKLKFAQNKGKCYELSYTKLISGVKGEASEWGKYHIYYTYLGGGSRNEAKWDDTFNNGSYTLNLSNSGIYEIQVVPYENYEIEYMIDVFLNWTTYPNWWVDNCTNGYYQQQNPCDNNIYVEYRTTSGGYLDSEYLTRAPGTYTISAKSFSGKKISGNSSCSVTVNSYGQANRSSITFYYEDNRPSSGTVHVYCYCGSSRLYSTTESISGSKYIYAPSISGYTAEQSSQYVYWDGYNPSPDTLYFYYTKNSTPVPPPAPSPRGQTVRPYAYDTQFCSQYADNDSNKKLYDKVPRLYDGSTSTRFSWYINKKEKTDNIPEFTFYFNNETVSGIKIINGDVRSYSYYDRGAKYNTIRFVVYDQSGSHTEYVYPNNSYLDSNYQTLYFSRTYNNVYRIEFWHGDADLGSGEYLYEITITDMQFFN